MEQEHDLSAQEIREWLEAARARGILSPSGLEAQRARQAPELLHPRSLQGAGRDTLAMARLPARDALLVVGPNEAGFRGTALPDGAGPARLCPLDPDNAALLRRLLPFTAPSAGAGGAPAGVTFGLGDRLGCAGPGHLRLFRRYAAVPVLAQQSVRELDLTRRTYEEVLAAATWAVFQEGFRRPWVADGDHLKTEEWVRKALGIGFTMITADVSDYIRGQFLQEPEGRVLAAYGRLPDAYRRRIEGRYLGLRARLDDGEELAFSSGELARIALIYREAVEHAQRLYRAGVEVKGEGGFAFELSVDETATPTTPQAHLFVGLEAQEAGIRVSSLAPRFVGEFQKGIDYIGDAAEFARSFRTHAAIARRLGYRISVHSGSDKFTVFPIVGRETGGAFHVKTAGTNWLEALKVIAAGEPALFREIWRQALASFEKARRYYHVTPDLASLPDAGALADGELVRLFENVAARQVMHITYGELLVMPELGPRFRAALRRNLERYWQALEQHIGRHLESLGVARVKED